MNSSRPDVSTESMGQLSDMAAGTLADVLELVEENSTLNIKKRTFVLIITNPGYPISRLLLFEGGKKNYLVYTKKKNK